MNTSTKTMRSSSTPASAPSAPRIYYLDWLRVLAILMVFLFHAVHPFDLGDWQVKNVEQSEILTIVLTFLSIWGMPFFFLTAGAAGWFALARRTGRQYLSERLTRLLLPFVVGAILFSPLEYYCETTNKIQRGVLTSAPGFVSQFLTFNPRFLHFPGFSPRWFGAAGYHLWFLGFLFSFALITLPLFLWLKRPSGQAALAWMARRCEARGGLLLFVVPAALIYCLLLPFFPSSTTGRTSPSRCSSSSWDSSCSPTSVSPAPCGGTGGCCSRSGSSSPWAWWACSWRACPCSSGMRPQASPSSIVLQVLRSTIAVCLSLVMVWVGMRFLDFTNRWLQYGQEAALPVFVLHQPVIIAIAFFVVQWNAGIAVKLPVVVLGSLAATLALYELVIRRLGFLRILFGMKAGRGSPLCLIE